MDQPAFDRRHADTPFQVTSQGVAFRTFGSGAPLVLLHGGAGDWRHWVLNVDALATRFRVLAFDLPNYGDSAAFGWEMETADFLDLCWQAITEAIDKTTTGAPSVHIGGFSFGGFIAAHMGVRLGPRLAALSMTGGAGYGPPTNRPFTLDSRKRMAARLDREPTPAEIRVMQAENLGKLMLWDRALIDDWTITMQVENIARTRFDSRRLSWEDGTPDLVGQVAAPVLVAYGEHDAAAIPAPADRIARCRAANPKIQTRLIPDCGHWAMYEAPETVNRMLLDFHGGVR